LPLCDCTVVDLTDRGARLAIPRAVGLPDQFVILLSPFVRPFRECRLVWRDAPYYGVEFDADWQQRFNASLAEADRQDRASRDGPM
jgi:hypothetical protein